MISLRPPFLYDCVHPIICDSESSNHLRLAEWSPPKEMLLIILLCINILTFSNLFTSLTCISDKIHTAKPILQTARNELQVIRECENINTQEND